MTFTVVLRIALVLLFFGAIDLYAFQIVKTLFKEQWFPKLLYWGISGGILVLLLVVIISFDRRKGMDTLFFWFTGLFILFWVPKMVAIAFLLVEDITRLVGGVVQLLPKGESSGDTFLPARRAFVSKAALITAALPFAGILHGIFKGRYNYRVLRHSLYFPDLPAAFDGLTITQISDLHTGSFTNPDKVKAGIELIKAQQSDIVVFTGDMVNNRASELEAWMDIYGKFEAPLGAYSIFGNHDYGDYSTWSSEEEKRENLQTLAQREGEMGFDLLRNEHRVLERGGEKLYLAGVENWGQGFHQYGDLDKALSGVPQDAFTLLLSHDPSHFDAVVKKHAHQVHATFSGHTHGMQFGIEIPGVIKWSPVKWRYPKWAGLYEEAGRYLHVNRGFGYLAFPGRVGMWPEITQLTLRRGRA